MARTAFQGLLPIEVVAVFLGFVRVFLGLDHFRHDEGLATEGGTHLITAALVLAHLFGYDVLCAFQCCSHIFDVALDEALCSPFRALLALHHQQRSQWLQSLFASRLGTCASLGFVGQVYVLQCRQFPAVLYAFLQFGCQLVQLADGFQDGLLALLYLFQPF